MSKKISAYQMILSAKFFEKTPKAVFAALAVSFVYNFQCPENSALVEGLLIEEWETLFEHALVSQKPFKKGGAHGR